MTRITSAIAAALIASASFASVALADGNYYEGATPPAAGEQHPAKHQDKGSVSYNYTGSISGAQQLNGQTVNSGDYYEGANRPN